MEGQLSIFGQGPDQDIFQSEKWGTLKFFPTKSDKWVDNCRHCLLWTIEEGITDECLRARCTPTEREDHRMGYYSIHQIPNEL